MFLLSVSYCPSSRLSKALNLSYASVFSYLFTKACYVVAEENTIAGTMLSFRVLLLLLPIASVLANVLRDQPDGGVGISYSRAVAQVEQEEITRLTSQLSTQNPTPEYKRTDESGRKYKPLGELIWENIATGGKFKEKEDPQTGYLVDHRGVRFDSLTGADMSKPKGPNRSATEPQPPKAAAPDKSVIYVPDGGE